MVILFMLFVAQFSIACACLAFNEEQQHKLAYEGWHQASMGLRNETQVYFNCCGFENASLPINDTMSQPSCDPVSLILSSLINHLTVLSEQIGCSKAVLRLHIFICQSTDLLLFFSSFKFQQ